MGWLDDLQHFTRGDRGAWVDFDCGHCGREVTGFVVGVLPGSQWMVCSSCHLGSVLITQQVPYVLYPSAKFGPELQGLPADVEEAYEEARRSYSVAAYVGTELLCRKLLMHVAVDKGAEAGKSFESYVDYLKEKGYITPTMEPWVDLIRQHGNMATHTLEKPDADRAKHTITFTAELLRVVYEMEYLAKQVGQGKPK